MMHDTVINTPVNSELVANYFKSLVNHFFKILPIREKEEGSLQTYISSLQVEIAGFRTFLIEIKDNSDFMKLFSILQFLHDNTDCDMGVMRREVFRAINLCNRLHDTYVHGGDDR